MKPGPSPEIIKRIEAIEDGPIVGVLRRCYVDERLSYRKLCTRWRINTRTLMRLLKHFGIPPRKGGEAVRTQWLGNSERRERAAQSMKRLMRRLKAEGRHPRSGLTEQNSESVRRMAERLREATSARRPEVRTRNARSHALYVRREPHRHATSLAAPTRAELLMLEHVRSLGLVAIHNHIVSTSLGPKWINVWVPSLNLGIGCESYGRFPLDWDRHAAISALGIRHVFITNRRIYLEQWTGLDHYVSCLKDIRPHPTVHRENTVIWGRVNPAVFKKDPDKATVECVAVNMGHEVLVTIAPDDPVLRAYRAYLPPA